jgi:hypothetical protein
VIDVAIGIAVSLPAFMLSWMFGYISLKKQKVSQIINNT